MFCNEKTIIIIYVNNLLITDFNKQINKKIKVVFNKRFHIINFDFITHYLNMRFERNKSQRILHLNQQTYLKKILKNHDFLNSKFVSTLIKTSIKLKITLTKYTIKSKFKHIYQLTIEFLMYAMLNIRFDIVFAVFVVSRYTSNLIENY